MMHNCLGKRLLSEVFVSEQQNQILHAIKNQKINITLISEWVTGEVITNNQLSV